MSAAVGFGCWLRQKNPPHGFCHSACCNLLQHLLQNCWALHHLPNGWSFGSAWLLRPYSPWQLWFTTTHDSRIVIVHPHWYASRIHSIPRKTTENSQITSHFTASASLQLITNVHATLLGVFHILPQLGPVSGKLRRSKWRPTRLQVTDYGSAVQRSWMILIYLNDTLMIWFIWWS